MRSTVARRGFSIGEYWCTLAHDQITWPVHGYYQCRKCRRIFRVPWNEPGHGYRNPAPDRTREVVKPETVAA